jgi:hypothetical protein
VAALLAVAGLGLYVTRRQRRSALPPVGAAPETWAVTGPTEPDQAHVDDEPPFDTRS